MEAMVVGNGRGLAEKPLHEIQIGVAAVEEFADGQVAGLYALGLQRMRQIGGEARA